jgi:hypothetical protein
MTRRFLILALFILSSIVLAEACHALDREESYFVYQSMRTALQDEFNQAVKMFSDRRSPSVTDKEFAVALDGVRMVHYNKVYIHVQCAQLAPRRQNVESFIKDCVHERLQAFQRVYTRSLSILDKGLVSPAANACYDQARLLEAEEQFPPFDFLAGPTTHLFNVKQLDGCLAKFDR